MQKRIMIVDDDTEFLDELKEILDTNGYNVAAFSSSETALKETYQFKPDLILLDVKMENLTGVQLAALLRLSNEIEKIPIIMMSGIYARRDIEESMKICRVNKYIKKPFTASSILSKISIALDK